MNLQTALDPMLRIDPLNWQGLPAATAAQFDQLFGAPSERIETVLGCFPTTRLSYPVKFPAGMLSVWVRDGNAVMIEIQKQPKLSVLSSLPEPSAVLPNEILLPAAYAHEYLYCDLGLVLTVAQPYKIGDEQYIARCRGLKILTSVRDFGPAYYQAFDDQVQWESLEMEVG